MPTRPAMEWAPPSLAKAAPASVRSSRAQNRCRRRCCSNANRRTRREANRRREIADLVFCFHAGFHIRQRSRARLQSSLQLSFSDNAKCNACRDLRPRSDHRDLMDLHARLTPRICPGRYIFAVSYSFWAANSPRQIRPGMELDLAMAIALLVARCPDL